MKNPSYRDVCTGLTGHAEVCQLVYDPKIISFETILEVFWQTHDPTTLNRQGADAGTQYRSAIFFMMKLKRIGHSLEDQIKCAKSFPKSYRN